MGKSKKTKSSWFSRDGGGSRGGSRGGDYADTWGGWGSWKKHTPTRGTTFEDEERFAEDLQQGNPYRGGMRVFTGFRSSFRFEEASKSIELFQIISFCRNLCVVHGEDTRILDISFCRGVETAFTDPTKRDQIFLGSDVVDASIDFDTKLSIYGGFSIHEYQHLISSKEFFTWILRNRTSLSAPTDEKDEQIQLKKVFYNILEDCRIEKIAIEDSPGFCGYLQETREHVFGDGVKMMEKEWKKSSPRSKFLQIITTALRYPQGLTDKMREYQIEGICPFDIVSTLDTRLETFKDVRKIGDLLTKILVSISKSDAELFKDLMTDLSGDLSEKTEGSDSSSKESDSLEDFKEVMEKEAKSDGDLLKKKFKLEEDKKELSMSSMKEDRGEDTEVAASIEEGATKAKLGPKTEAVSKALKKKKGFGASDIDDLVSKISQGMIDAATSDELSSLKTEESSIIIDKDDNKALLDPSGTPRKILIKKPKLSPKGKQAKEQAIKLVTPYIKSAQQIFLLRIANRMKRARDKKEGSLDRRRLCRSQITDRLFFTEQKFSAVGFSICLLLDESGSMGGVYRDNLKIGENLGTDAFLIGVLLEEALRRVPKIDLQIYSHTSFGGSSYDVKISHLYGGTRNDCGLGEYGQETMQNYDHLAIKHVGERFKKQAKYNKKFMFVIADGQPAGSCYGGKTATKATKEEVEKLSREGVKMFCLGLGGHDPSDMFKNYARFDGDFPSFLKEVKKITSSEILKTGMEKV